jgi:hypothetical protein
MACVRGKHEYQVQSAAIVKNLVNVLDLAALGIVNEDIGGS